eukprot:6822054-Pyramimonas_sp.AAC.2
MGCGQSREEPVVIVSDLIRHANLSLYVLVSQTRADGQPGVCILEEAREQPNTAGQAANNDANVRSEKGTTSSSSGRPTHDIDEEDDDEDLETYTNEVQGKSVSKLHTFGQPVLGTNNPGAVQRKTSLPSLASLPGEK